MIYVDRNRIPEPEFFSSSQFLDRYAELTSFYSIDQSDRRQRSFKKFLLPVSVIKDLFHLFNGKCAYCESKVIVNTIFKSPSNVSLKKTYEENLGAIGNFRPRNNARGFNKEAASTDHYWWLSYEWNNLYLSCQTCFTNKSNWFPVGGGDRASIMSDYETIVKTEQNLLIDPCNDRIEFHLEFDFLTGSIFPIDFKGKTTIEILNLNRRDLVKRRKKALTDELRKFERFKENINEEELIYLNEKKGYIGDYFEALKDFDENTEFLGLRKAYINKLIKNDPEIRQFIKDKIINKKTDKNDINENFIDPKNESIPILKGEKIKDHVEELKEVRTLLRNVHIDKIELKNFKCFESLTINIPEIIFEKLEEDEIPQEHWLVFLGENGVGKSSLIKAVAMALMGNVYLKKLNPIPTRILRRGKRKGHIKVYGSKQDEIYEVTFDKNEIKSNIEEPACYLLGYGSTRLLPKGNLTAEEGSEYAKAKNLFDYSVALTDAKEWLLGLPQEEFDLVAMSIKDLLLLDDEDDIKVDKKTESLYIEDRETRDKIDIEDLSDGYKSVFALTIDIIKTLSIGNLTFKEAEAVVLLDEIGTHLHPRWKMEIVKRLRKTFPRIQFIVTTHEPLCLKGLKNNEVIVLKKDEDGKVISVADLPNPSDFRVDQLLTSEYFGLNSTIDIETENKFKEYYDLLAKEERTPDDDNRISELASELPNKIGTDIRDELAYYAIDQLLAKKVKTKGGFKLINEGIKQEAVDRVKEIWDFIDSHD